MESLIDVDHVYICHYKKLVDRKIKVLEQLDLFKITNFSFVELFDKDNWDESDILKKYPKINDTNMTPAEKSLALKHAWIVQDMHEKKYDSILVLEDDVVLCENFVQQFNHYKKQLPKDWDIGWVGSCFNLREPEIPGLNVYKTDRGSRCTHAYILSEQFAKKIIIEIKNINLVSDCYYNHIVKQFNLNNYWFQPALAFQSLEFFSSLKENFNHKWKKEEMG